MGILFLLNVFPSSRVLENSVVSQSRNAPHFMQPEPPSSRLKEPSNCPYPKPHQSNSHHPIRFLLRCVLPVSHQSPKCSEWALSLRFPHQSLYTPFLSLIHATCHTLLIIFDLVSQIIFGEGFHEVIYCAASSVTCILVPLMPISSSAPQPQTPSAYILPSL